MSKPLSPEARIASLEVKLEIPVSDRKLALNALTHKSYCNEHRDEQPADNERLEFLGDAVIDLGISHRLMQRFPQADEGELSKLRAQIVNEEGLAKIAQRIQLGDLLLLGRGEELTGGREKPSVLADALEAVLGAIYFSDGMPRVMEIVDRLFAQELEAVAEGRADHDYKSLLQEEVQKSNLRQTPRYRVVSESGPDHLKVFEIEVNIGEKVWARSTGRSKKEAEQAAARETLKMMRASTPGPADPT